MTSNSDETLDNLLNYLSSIDLDFDLAQEVMRRVRKLLKQDREQAVREAKVEALEDYAHMCGIMRVEPSTHSLQLRISELQQHEPNNTEEE